MNTKLSIYGKRGLAVAVLAISAAAGTSAAATIEILAAQSSGPVPGAAGAGLTATFYKFGSNPGTLAGADALIAGASGPTATFTAQNVCFPTCGNVTDDSGTLASYVSTNGTSLVDPTSATLGQFVTRYNGYIAVATAGTYTFALSSDDGSELLIGNTLIVNADGDHSFAGGSSDVTFDAAGLYSFYVEHFEDGGVTGVTVLENNAALSTASLYASAGNAAPEPASVLLFAVGLLAIGLAHRRRKSCTPGR